MTKTLLAFTAASLLLIVPASAQTSATPTGKSDTKSSGMMKKGSAAKPHHAKAKHKTM